MPFTANEITELGYSSLDFYLKNKPVDQIDLKRPLLAKLMAKKKYFPGGNDTVVEQLRKSYDADLQWVQGADTVTYNTRNTLDQARFPWKGAHDGFEMNEDYLLANGITLTDSSGPGTNTKAEMLQLTNLFQESSEVLRIGFEEGLDLAVHRTAGAAEELEGLDTLIALDPTTGTVGGINRATAGNEFWRNNFSTGVAAANMIDTMETMWRACILHGGAPDCILAGEDFVDAFRTQSKGEVSRYMVQQSTFTTPGQIDPSIAQGNQALATGLQFQSVPIYYDPTFTLLDTLDSPVSTWAKRCYFINSKHLCLRPAQGHDMVPRKPPRSFDKYVHRWALTWKGALTMNRANAHAVITIA
jgi:hypothetical protein